MKKITPSKAQAKLIASLWGRDTFITEAVGADGYVDPTRRVCIKRGWLNIVEGFIGTYPNGQPFEQYEVSSAGIDALEDYLREARYRRSEK